MNKRTINFIAVLIGAFAFNFIFWKEDVALNFTLFSLFSILVNFINSSEMFSRRNVQITTAGNLVACFFLLYQHSIISVIAALTSWVIMIGFYQIDELRTVHRAFFSSIINFFRLPPFLMDVNWKKRNVSQKSIGRKFRIVLFPVIGLLIFYWIFLQANPVFAEMNDGFWHDVTWFFETFLAQVSIQRLVFFLMGFLISSWFIYKAIYTSVYDKERSKKVDLLRIRKKRKKTPSPHYPKPVEKGLGIGLKNENRSGVLMMGMISILLLFVNVLDIVYVWFGNDFNPTRDYSADVHKGVNLLIFSILLSIFIMIYYFRKNQNFYKNNNILKQMAYFWILQNVILIISVIFRNAHYIQFHGLTQKRIGVYVFLAVVILGLISLTLKIAQRKSFFYMSKFNSWSLYGVLIFLSCFNWDMIIFNHNFANRNEKEIDLTYLVDLSDEVILAIDKHKNVLFKEYKIGEDNLYSRSGFYRFDRRMRNIEYRVENDAQSLFSWNYRKAKIENIVKNVKLTPNRAALDKKEIRN